MSPSADADIVNINQLDGELEASL